MSDSLKLEYDVPGDDFSRAGEASAAVKKTLKQLGFPAEVVRRVAISLYEGEINMVIHANGGKITVTIEENKIQMLLEDNGPGISDVGLAMKEGYSTASAQIRDLGFGAGMGLPNMKQYTDSFEIKSEIGVGTTVSMVIENR